MSILRFLVSAALALVVACGGSGGGPADSATEPGPDAVADLPPVDVLYVDSTGDEAGEGADPAGEPSVDGAAEGTADGADAENAFVYPCEPLTIEACETACGSSGLRKCLKGWGPCIPPEETCGDCDDDDCDGEVDEGCPPDPSCQPTIHECPVAAIAVAETGDVWTGTTLHLSASKSTAKSGSVTKWAWSVEAPLGSQTAFQPSADVESPTFLVDAGGQYLFQLDVWDDAGMKSCVPALATVAVKQHPVIPPEIGCADGSREGFQDTTAYPQIAACSGAWDHPGVTAKVAQTCGGKGGNGGTAASGTGCSTPDLCATGWHVCKGWQEVAAKSSTGCAGSTPPDAKPKSLFFAIVQPSKSFSVCGAEGDGDNDVFGCGNLGHTLSADKNCGPLDRALASMQADKCGYNEAEPPLGPWECKGGAGSDLKEGALVTKKACQDGSCSYDGQPVNPSDKGGVLCCRDAQ